MQSEQINYFLEWIIWINCEGFMLHIGLEVKDLFRPFFADVLNTAIGFSLIIEANIEVLPSKWDTILYLLHCRLSCFTLIIIDQRQIIFTKLSKYWSLFLFKTQNLLRSVGLLIIIKINFILWILNLINNPTFFLQ